MQENAARWHFESVTRPRDHLPNFGFQLAAILYFPKGFTYDFGSKSEICHVFVYGYCGPGSFRVVTGSSKPFTKISNWASSGGLWASGFFSSSNQKAIQYSLNSNGPGMEQAVHKICSYSKNKKCDDFNMNLPYCDALIQDGMHFVLALNRVSILGTFLY